jgi:HAD superfamily hydrolase (TIGR01509 family)
MTGLRQPGSNRNASSPPLTILWDNDGVLVDTEELYFQATKAILQTVGIDLAPEQFKEISLKRGESTFTPASQQGFGDEEIARLRTERDQLYEERLGSQSWAVEGVEQVLRCLHGQVRMGVVTSTRRQHFEIAHAKTGLKKYLDFVIAHEDYRRTKPHPDPYLTAMERHGFRPDECIVVEDSERGLTAATAAGLECLIVLSEWTKDGDFRRARKVLENVSCVPEEVLTWAKPPAPTHGSS